LNTSQAIIASISGVHYFRAKPDLDQFLTGILTENAREAPSKAQAKFLQGIAVIPSFSCTLQPPLQAKKSIGDSGYAPVLGAIVLLTPR